MFFTDIVVILAIVLFIVAVAIELRANRDKKMYVGREAKTREPDASSAHVPVVQTQAAPPVVTQEELKKPPKSA